MSFLHVSCSYHPKIEASLNHLRQFSKVDLVDAVKFYYDTIFTLILLNTELEEMQNSKIQI